MEVGATSETFGRRDAAVELTGMYPQRVAEVAPTFIRPSSQVPHTLIGGPALLRKNPMQIPLSICKVIEYPVKGAAVVSGDVIVSGCVFFPPAEVDSFWALEELELAVEEGEAPVFSEWFGGA